MKKLRGCARFLRGSERLELQEMANLEEVSSYVCLAFQMYRGGKMPPPALTREQAAYLCKVKSSQTLLRTFDLINGLDYVERLFYTSSSPHLR